jgi:hypothetical protein
MALGKNCDIAQGLHELLNDDALASTRKQAIFGLLNKHPNSRSYHLDQMLRAALAYSEAIRDLAKLVKKALNDKRLGEEQRAAWVSVGFIICPNKYESEIRNASKKPVIVWKLRSLLSDRSDYENLAIGQLETITRIVARHFPQVPAPMSSSGDQNPWDGAAFVRALIDRLSSLSTHEASTALRRLAGSPLLTTYQDYIKHALANQQARVRETEYRQPNWRQTIDTISNGAPANFADLQALVVDHFSDLNNEIKNRNIDTYRQFWNEKSYGRISTPRSEETCRDILVGMLQARLRPLNITVEPEGHMAADKRVDVSIALNHRKTLMELKRDYHPDVWRAHQTQLDRLYTSDPDASGYGVYGVFWFGSQRPRRMPSRPDGGSAPSSASEMQEILTELIPPEKREKLSVVVLDVSGPVGSRTKSKKVKANERRAAGAKRTKLKRRTNRSQAKVRKLKRRRRPTSNRPRSRRSHKSK